MNTAPATAPLSPLRRPAFWGFVVLMLALAVFFLGLGKWQLDRLAWKEGLIASVAANMQQPPVALPPVADWPTLDVAAWQYRPVTFAGQFRPHEAVRAFIGLSGAKGRYSGPGYWIMTPFALSGGGTVWVNRGFVPQDAGNSFADDKNAPSGEITLTGVVVASEATDMFTPAPDPAHRIDWLRNIPRLDAQLGADATPIAPFYVDLPAGPPGALPQGGETTVDFPDNHFGYAMTWFGFALVAFIMLAEWVRRQFVREESAGADGDSTGAT